MPVEYSVEKPLNREPPMRELVKSFITEATTAYDRNHSGFPHIDGETFHVRIDGAVTSVTELSMAALRNDFPQHEVIAALQCAGNRRHTMRTKVREVDGIDWKDGAVCNCLWSGPLLADVLDRIGVTITGEAHVAFNCLQTGAQDDSHYAGSIPLSRCLDRTKQVILALDMNGHPISINHGFPLRAVIPGIAGARWTKWLDRITVQHTESDNFYMQRDYKILPPHVRTKAQALEYWPKAPAIQGLPINSIIAYPEANSTLTPADLSPCGELEVCGYALPQGDAGPVTKVEVSTDMGKTWNKATIVYPHPTEIQTPAGQNKYRWSWAIWKYKLPRTQVQMLTKGDKIWSRATDMGGNMQDDTVPWNFRGVAYNAYGETTGLRVVQRKFTNGVNLTNGANIVNDVNLANIANDIKLANGVAQLSVSG